MMVVPSLASLLFAVTSILSPRAKTAHAAFEATASPFTLTFRRSARGVRVSGSGGEIDQGSVESFTAAVHRDVVGFATLLIGSLPPDEDGTADLHEAVTAFTRAAPVPPPIRPALP
ncbi:hypothetical protein B7R54_03555 [Subtercola boreus]|uniref:Uncharacterized protein n=2 Tax=Subtercola boreus TaxID=120213 RepID=A0A3E0VFG6_9MICO|nr:hypothetical protein B7R54_03555 [Subtercola boreus]